MLDRRHFLIGAGGLDPTGHVFTVAGGSGGGPGHVFDTLPRIQAAIISASIQNIVCTGYSISGDLLGRQMIFARVSSGSSGMPYVRSADRYLPNGSTDPTHGGYWILANNIVMPEMFGAKRDGTTDDYPAIIRGRFQG
jgi:hypothetical protein